MKTILVIYSNTKVTEENYAKRYVFKTSDEVKEGDRIKSPKYDTPMQVTKVLDREYKYFNKVTGDLSDEFNNSNQFEIRELKIVEENSNLITATKIKEED